MKKIISLFIALILILSLGTVAFAKTEKWNYGYYQAGIFCPWCMPYRQFKIEKQGKDKEQINEPENEDQSADTVEIVLGGIASSAETEKEEENPTTGAPSVLVPVLLIGLAVIAAKKEKLN